MTEKTNRLERLQQENNLLKEIIKTQKHTIDLLIKHYITNPPEHKH